MLVSVIIPVYNVEKYLSRCIKSVQDQTYKDLEIILVDDGSTDSSGKLCDDFAQVDSRAIVIHKENGGLSSARNAGIEVANGVYTTFVDSDDYIASDYIEESVKLCEKYQAQISILNMKYVYGMDVETNSDNVFGEAIVMDSERAIAESLYQKLYSCCAPAKMYKTDIVKHVQFPDGKLSEDLATCHLFMNEAVRIVFSHRIGYFYWQRDDSIMHEFNEKRMDALEWAEKIESYCKENYPNIQKAAKCRVFNVALHLLLELPDSGTVREKHYEHIISIIKRTRGSVIFDVNTRFREKAAAGLSFLGKNLLKTIWGSKLAVRK